MCLTLMGEFKSTYWILKQKEEDLIRDLSIKDLKGNIFQFKLVWLFFVLNVIASFIAGNFELVSKWFDLIR